MGGVSDRVWQVAILLAVAAFLILQWLAGYAFLWAFLLAVLVAAVAVLVMWLLRDRMSPESGNRFRDEDMHEEGRLEHSVTLKDHDALQRPVEAAIAPPIPPPAEPVAEPQPEPPTPAPAPAPPEPAPVEAPEPLPIASEEEEAADDLAELADLDDEALTDAEPENDAPEESSGPAVPDDLRAIKGIGPKIEATLHAAGITTFAQIAGWSADDIARIESQLQFAGRIGRDDWVAQARRLAADKGQPE